MLTTNPRRTYRFLRLTSGGWVRYDENGDHPHATSGTDESPVRSQAMSQSGYDSACSWCYLGAQHTESAHTLALS